MQLPALPLTAFREQFLSGTTRGPLLLEAEPGAGKSTLAPLWMLEAIPPTSVLWVVQPRVLAAQALAQRLARLFEEEMGGTVGYQIPFDHRASRKTRVLFMTPGILLQHLLQNPTLEGVGAVILDEVHERSVNQDLAWAWLQETAILRDDLQLVLMSATPDPALQQQLPQRLFAEGYCFPVTTHYQPPNTSPHLGQELLPQQLIRALSTQASWQQTTSLVFLAGWRDIEDCARELKAAYPDHKILRLHSRVPALEQARALDPAEGPRIILATNIAETSLTITDVTLVIDSGWVRRAAYEQRTGITRLRTTRISQASADQRRGRAGRVAAGHCIRLWSQDQPLVAADLPEIRTCDYLPLALRLGHWGTRESDLNWLEPPNPLALQQARELLRSLGMLDGKGKITAAGYQVSDLGTHPRTAAILQAAVKGGKIPQQVLLMALALHFEWSADSSLDAWLEVAADQLGRDRRWRLQRQRWLGVLGAVESDQPIPAELLARAFPDRIGFRQASGRYRLNCGISVEPLDKVAAPWALFPQIQPVAKGHRGPALVLQLTLEAQQQLSQRETDVVFKQGRWQGRNRWRMGGQVIAEVVEPLSEDVLAVTLGQHIVRLIIEKGLEVLPWSASARSLRARAQLLSAVGLLSAPDLTDQGLTVTVSQWLQPFLDEHTPLESLPLLNALEAFIGYDNCQQLSRLLPENLALPSGRQVPLTFASDGTPEVAAKLQEFFGCESLQLAGGRIPLRIHLLSPNGSPLAITTNLSTFWRQAYPEVRKEMRGRYPRHPWPDNPLDHVATSLTKKRLQQP